MGFAASTWELYVVALLKSQCTTIPAILMLWGKMNCIPRMCRGTWIIVQRIHVRWWSALGHLFHQLNPNYFSRKWKFMHLRLHIRICLLHFCWNIPLHSVSHNTCALCTITCLSMRKVGLKIVWKCFQNASFSFGWREPKHWIWHKMPHRTTKDYNVNDNSALKVENQFIREYFIASRHMHTAQWHCGKFEDTACHWHICTTTHLCWWGWHRVEKSQCET